MNNRNCLGCGEPLTGMRADAKYHGESCRSRVRHSSEQAAEQKFRAGLAKIRRPERAVARRSPANEGS